MTERRALALILLLALGSCSTARRGSPPEASQPVRSPEETRAKASPSATDPVLASFEGGEIRLSELGSYLLRVRRRESLAALSRMVGEAILRQEVSKLGISVARAFLVEERARLKAAIEREALRDGGIRMSVENYVSQRFRQTPAEHLESRLQESVRRWLFERVIRYHGLTSERAVVSILVVDDRELALRLRQEIVEGADFAAQARKHSLHESQKDGGRLPALTRDGLNPEVARLAFSLEPGRLSPLIPIGEGGQRRFELMRVEERLPALEGGYPRLSERVEKSLREEPLGVHEWTSWMLQLERVYKVRLSAKL